MIRSFADEPAAAVWADGPASALRRVPPEVRARARRKLAVLHSAESLDAVGALPGTRLEALRGDLAGFWSIRVNDQWRIVFRWTKGEAADVRLLDYHD